MRNDLCQNPLFSRQMICKQYIILNHVFFRYEKGKAIDFTSLRTSSGQASWPYEMVPIGTISSPSEGGRKPRGENHQAKVISNFEPVTVCYIKATQVILLNTPINILFTPKLNTKVTHNPNMERKFSEFS